MKLVICEKASLARAVADCIGSDVKNVNKMTFKNGDFLICFLAGHILEHLSPEEYDEKYAKWREEDLPIYFPDWKKKVSPSKKDIFNNVKELLQRDDITHVINAGDMDSEGQLLVDEVLTYLNNKLPVLRLNTADTTPTSLYKSLTHLEDNNKYKGLSESAEARSLADMIFGFSFSRFFTLKSGAKLNVGRVKTPTLDLVVKRDREIENFVPKKYISIYFKAIRDEKDVRVKLELQKDDEFLDVNGYLSNEDNADKIIADNNLQNREGVIEGKQEDELTPLPFNLATLQKRMEALYGFAPSKTMEVTQSLRDKYNAITYNRSECEFLPASYYDGRDKHIATILENLGGLPEFKEEKGYKSKCFNDEKIQLHFGIIPQNIKVDVSALTEDERKCYVEIAKRFLMQFMGNNTTLKKTLTVLLKDERKAKAHSKEYVKKGWLLLKEESDDDKKEEEAEGNVNIPFDDGKGVYYLDNPEKIKKETKPPKRYTQATLIQDMCRISRFVKDERIKELLLRKDKDKSGDKGSIGTTATRDGIINTMIKQNYLLTKGKQIISSPLARNFIDILPESVKSIDTTALWYKIQERIENNEAGIEELTEAVIENFNSIVRNSSIEYKIENKENIRSEAKKDDPFFETEKSFCYKIDEDNIRSVFKNNLYFESIGWKPTKANLKTLLKTGVCKGVKLVSKKTGKEYTANVKAEFEKREGSKFLNPKFSLEFENKK